MFLFLLLSYEVSNGCRTLKSVHCSAFEEAAKSEANATGQCADDKQLTLDAQLAASPWKIFQLEKSY